MVFDKNGIDRATTVDKVVAVLRQAMFDGDLSPGEQLRDVHLSKGLGVGRSTIREALQGLIADGLVTRTPSRGVVVRQLTMADVGDIFKARLVLEIHAARAAQSCTESALDEFAQAMQAYTTVALAGDATGGADAHVGFHAAMVGLIGSQRLVEVERALMRELQLAIASIERSSDDLPTEIGKHRVLWELITSLKTDEAIKTIEGDLAHAKAFVSRYAVDAPKDAVSTA